MEHSSTVDRTVAELRRAIFDGELESGIPLREVALAETLRVSRPTVREALGMLVAEGLAVREPHRGERLPPRGCVGARHLPSPVGARECWGAALEGGHGRAA